MERGTLSSFVQQNRSRLRLAVLTSVVGIGAMMGWTYHLREQAIATTPIREFTVASAAQRVRDAHGRVVILVIYRANSDDPFVVGDLRRWTTQLASPKVELFGLAVGNRRDAQ